MNQMEARALVAGLLLERVRQERYPSATQMAILEETLPAQMLPDYLDVLVEKVAGDRWPSISMLHRIRRVTESLR